MQKYKVDLKKIRKSLPYGALSQIARELEVKPSSVSRFFEKDHLTTIRDLHWLKIVLAFKEAYENEAKFLTNV